MTRRVEDTRHRPFLHHPAEIHHHDPVTQAAHHGQVVADEKQGQPKPSTQVRHQGEDLGLDGNVQRRNRFIRDQELGAGRQRPGDAHALTLPARELMRVPVGVRRRQADLR